MLYHNNSFAGCVSLARRDRRQLAFLPQQADLDRQFPLRVDDLVAMGLLRRRGVFGRLTPYNRQQFADALAQVGMAEFAHQPIGHLSGGQFQRVLFARLLVQQAPVILLDEPFTGVDETTVRLLLALIAGWHTQQRTVIAVLHDMQIVREWFPHTLLLHPQGNLWGSTPHVLAAAAASRAVAPVGFSTEAEASARGVAALIGQIKQQHISAYFIENQTDPRLVKQIAAASGAEPGGELYPEALSKPGGPAPTYVQAFQHNVTALVNSMK